MNYEMFKALGDPNRLTIFNSLRYGEKCACKLLEELEITQPTLSHHMSVMTRSGLVKTRKSGQWSYYSLEPAAVAELSEFFSSVKDDVSIPCICDECE